MRFHIFLLSSLLFAGCKANIGAVTETGSETAGSDSDSGANTDPKPCSEEGANADDCIDIETDPSAGLLAELTTTGDPDPETNAAALAVSVDGVEKYVYVLGTNINCTTASIYANQTPNENSQAINADLSSLDDGEYTLCILAVTNANQLAAASHAKTINFVLDRLPPVIDDIDDVSTTDTATLTTAVDDDTATYSWSKVSGTGAITFASATALTTTAAAASDGVYILKFTATDRAGNTAEKTFQLTKNATAGGSNINPGTVTVGTVSASEIAFSWVAPSDLPESYTLAYKIGSTSPATCADGTATIVANIASGLTAYNISGLNDNTQYAFRLCGYSSAAGQSIGRTFSALTDTTPSTEPTNFATGTITATSIQLQWTAPTVAPASYKIARIVGITAPTSCTDADATIISGIANNLTSYVITGLYENTKYSFRICSVDGSSTVSTGVTISSQTPLDSTPPAFTMTLAGSVLNQFGTTYASAWQYASGSWNKTFLQMGSTAGEVFSKNSSVVYGANGWLYAYGFNDSLYLRSSNDLSTWSSATLLAGHNVSNDYSDYMSILQDATGNVQLLTADVKDFTTEFRYNVVLFKRAAGSSTWSNTGSIPGVTTSGYTSEQTASSFVEDSFAMGPDHRSHLGFFQRTSTDATYVYGKIMYTKETATGWLATPIQVNSGADCRWTKPGGSWPQGIEPVIRVDNNNVVHMVYSCDTNGTDHNVYYAKLVSGGTWQRELIDNTVASQWLSLTLDRNNKPYIFYINSAGLTLASTTTGAWALELISNNPWVFGSSDNIAIKGEVNTSGHVYVFAINNMLGFGTPRCYVNYWHNTTGSWQGTDIDDADQIDGRDAECRYYSVRFSGMRGRFDH